MIKKNIVLIPSAWNHKALGDVILFADHYKKDFSVVVISDLYEELEVIVDEIKYIKARTSLSDYYVFTSEYIIDAGTLNRHSLVSQNQRRVSVWHGVPYKKMFVDLDKKHMYSALNYQRAYDTMISPSKYYTDKFLRDSMLYNGEVLEIGSSRIDSLFLDNDKKNEIKSDLSIKTNKVVLYAPTYRKAGSVTLPFDHKQLLTILGEDYTLVVKLHYLNSLDGNYKNVIDATEYSNINEILSVTDLLISDYSSLMFDYSVIGKNIILYQYDIENYTDERGFMFDITEFIERKYVCTTETGLYEALNDINKQDLTAMKRAFYPLETGNSTINIVEQLKFIPDTRTGNEVIFIINELNQIGGVHGVVKNLAKLFKARTNCKIIVLAMSEYNKSNDKVHHFDGEGLVDIQLTKQSRYGAAKAILQNTNGLIISLQFSAHMTFQPFMKDKNVVLMFHGDTKDVVDRSMYKWHLDSLNSQAIYNYKSLALLSETNKNILLDVINPELKEKLTYVENSFDFDVVNKYVKNNIFVAVTRFDVDKNIFDLVEIFKNEKLNEKSVLHVYGDGPLKNDLIDEIKKNKLERKIILMGYESDKKLIFSDKAGLVSTGLSEGMPLVFLEAYNFGIPVYCYDSFTAVKDVTSPLVSKLAEVSNVEHFVSNLNENFNHDINNFIEFTSKFSNDVIYNKWINLLYSIKDVDSVEFIPKDKQPFSIKNRISAKIKKTYRKLPMNKKLIVLNAYMYQNEHRTLKKIDSQPLVSFIVPFYKNEEYIETLVKSIYAQKYKNFEIVVINDGFNYDETYIVNKYSKIKYFKKDNEGLGLTRNYGINKAKGEYLFFIDPDDTIPRGSTTSLVSYALTHNLAVVAGKTSRIKYDDQNERSVWYNRLFTTSYVNNKAQRNRLFADTLSTNKLYHRQSLIDSGIKFETGLYEDKLFSAKIYNYFDEIGVINKHVYNWFVYGENTTITTTLTINNFIERYNRVSEIYSLVDEKYQLEILGIALNHDFKLYLNKYCNYTIEEKKTMFEMISGFITGAQGLYNEINIQDIFNLEYIDAAINKNFEHFDKICTIHSKVLSEIEERKK